MKNNKICLLDVKVLKCGSAGRQGPWYRLTLEFTSRSNEKGQIELCGLTTNEPENKLNANQVLETK